MKETLSFTHNVSYCELNCFIYYNNKDHVNFLAELNIFNKLYRDFELSKEGCSKLCVSNYKSQEWELYNNVCVFSSVLINKNNNNNNGSWITWTCSEILR